MSRIQAKNSPDTLADEPFSIGIDVSKFHLDVYIDPTAVSYRVTNSSAGIKQLLKRFDAGRVRLIVMEATGRYHRLAFQSLHDAGLPVAVMNPYRTRRFADTVGQLAKTDHIDAKTLARFATTITPRPSVPVSPSMTALGDLLTARRQVVQERATLLNQLSETSVPLVARQIRARIKMCARHRDAIEAQVRKLISECEILRQKFDILTSIPGVALITAATLLAELSELGEVTGSQIAALVGVAPMNHDSGASRGKRRIKGGRKNLRKLIYMASLTAIKANPDMRRFYERLKANGKPFKVALSAVMRKMVILANSLISENRCWSKTCPV